MDGEGGPKNGNRARSRQESLGHKVPKRGPVSRERETWAIRSYPEPRAGKNLPNKESWGRILESGQQVDGRRRRFGVYFGGKSMKKNQKGQHARGKAIVLRKL